MPVHLQKIDMPEFVYHGTLDVWLDSFRDKLLNSRFWKPQRDFGEGLYTTTSLRQAQNWSIGVAQEYEGKQPGHPCVLQIRLLQTSFAGNCRIFMGANPEWAAFVLRHRLHRVKGTDPCDVHADICAGPMADNRTSTILQDMVLLGKDLEWFHDQITRDEQGRRLDSSRLGNQIVFCNEQLGSLLQLSGYYIRVGGKWRYHGLADIRQA